MAGSAEDEASDNQVEPGVHEDEVVFPDREALSSAMEVLSQVDLDLAYSSEKLVNLHILLTYTLAWDDFEEVDVMNEDISVESIEKALTFDLLSGFLEGEVVELERNMRALQVRVLNVQLRIGLCRQKGEMFTVMEGKLRDSEKSWKQFRDRITEMKMLSAKLPRSLLGFQNKSCKVDDGVDIEESPIIGNSLIQADQQRCVLWMLEKSLARELDFERKFLEAREHEEEFKLKLHYTEQVVSHMEEAAEAALVRLLEADNAAEVLLGTSKESLSRLEIIQFNLKGSLQRENDLKSKLENFLDLLKIKEEIIQKLQGKHEEDNIEMIVLHEKVKSLEEKLKESETRNQAAAASNEGKLGEVENMVDTLRETIAIAESRAESAEAKLTVVSETNLELTEELGFLKSNDPNAEKVTLLETQLRDREIRLQHAKAAAEAGQEQQTLLYTAIWDMETLIEDLKSKVSKYESKIESTEEQCLLLSESNFELNKELGFLRERLELVETSLKEANSENLAISTDINIRSKLIMDMVAKIATERERIQRQLTILSEENNALAHKLHSRIRSSAITPHMVNEKIGNQGLASIAPLV